MSDVFGLQQNYSNPVEPTLEMTSSYALTNFEGPGLRGGQFPGGSIWGNDKVWRKFTFAQLTTSKTRVLLPMLPATITVRSWKWKPIKAGRRR